MCPATAAPAPTAASMGRSLAIGITAAAPLPMSSSPASAIGQNPDSDLTPVPDTVPLPTRRRSVPETIRAVK